MAENPIKAPSADVFTAFTSPYAAMLAADQDVVSRPMSKLALMLRAGNGAQGYADLLNQSNAMAMQAAEQSDRYNLGGKLIERAADITKAGLGMDAVNVEGSPVTFDPTRSAQAAGVYLNNTQSDTNLNNGQMVHALAQAGRMPSDEDLNDLFTNPIGGKRTEIKPYISYDDQTRRISAEADMVSAHRPVSSGGDGDGGVRYELTSGGEFKEPQIKVTGKDPEAVRNAFYDRNGGNGGGGGRKQGAIPDAAAAISDARRRGQSVEKSGNNYIITRPDGMQVRLTVHPDGSATKQRVR